MKTQAENYRYDDCGLPYVVLEAVEVSRCPECGYVEVAIHGVENVHRRIAWVVANKDSRLTAAEIRFLRKFVGFSSADFAEVMGVDNATVSRWENGIRAMGATADRLVRMLAMTHEPVDGYPIDHLKQVVQNLRQIDSEKAEPVRMDLVRNEDDWQLAPA
jgi:putative zinc finger/helix-turn-helix YgiT family protein